MTVSRILTVRLRCSRRRSRSSCRRTLPSEGVEGGAELVDLGVEAGEGEGFAGGLAVFFNNCSQFRSPVEGRAADGGAGGDRVEGDRVRSAARSRQARSTRRKVSSLMPWTLGS